MWVGTGARTKNAFFGGGAVQVPVGGIFIKKNFYENPILIFLLYRILSEKGNKTNN